MKFKALLFLMSLLPTLAIASAGAVFKIISSPAPSTTDKSTQEVPKSNNAAVTPPSALSVPKQNPQNLQMAAPAVASSSKNIKTGEPLTLPSQAPVDSGTTLQATPPK